MTCTSCTKPVKNRLCKVTTKINMVFYLKIKLVLLQSFDNLCGGAGHLVAEAVFVMFTYNTRYWRR